jgi:hypothetical protein
MTSPALWLALALWFGAAQSAPQQPPKEPAAQEKPATQQKAPAKTQDKAPPKKAKRVFTNDDLENSAARPNPRRREKEEEAEEASESKPTKAAAKRAAARPEETQEYYYEKMAPLRSELSQVESDLSSARYKPEYDPQTGRPIISHTKQNEIERLERKRGDLQKRIAAVCEEAARNNVSVGGC